MNGRPELGPIVAVSIFVLLTAQVAIAQVDWTYQDLAVGPGNPGSWDSGRHLVGDVVFDGATYHMFWWAVRRRSLGTRPGRSATGRRPS